MLFLELELLTGVYRASLGDRAEWPPHPERVFSAFVQAWSDGGCSPEQREALEWLEGQDLPFLEASPEYFERDAPKVFVPPNDSRGNQLTVLPQSRRRQERNFRAAIPAHPIIRFYWAAEPPDRLHKQLSRLAGGIVSLGHSASLIRCAFGLCQAMPEAVWRPQVNGPIPLRTPYHGRATDLERWHASGRRPMTLRTERYCEPIPRPTGVLQDTVFGGPQDWFIFEDAGGTRPDILGIPTVARRLRDALMSLGDQPPPALISGHQPDGTPANTPHAAVIPLCNVGWAHSTGDLLGVALVLPRSTDASERLALLRALGTFVGLVDGQSQGRLEVAPGMSWILERSASPNRSSVSPTRYCRASTVWASVTPMFLDRFPDGGDAAEEAAIVAAACRHIGIAEEPVEIELHKYSAFKGAPPAYPARTRAGTDWAIPPAASFRNRPRRHVVLRFERPVTGPVILGAARYHGLGLCLPLGGGDV